MKGFNRIPLLAVSVMATAAILAPHSGFLVPKNVYAVPAHPLSFVHVEGPATFIDTTTTTSTTINVETQYRCSPSTPDKYTTLGDISVTLTQPTGTGTGTAAPPSIICDNHEHDTNVSVTATTTRSTPPPLGVGKASFAATLSNNNLFTSHNTVATTRGNIIVE